MKNSQPDNSVYDLCAARGSAALALELRMRTQLQGG